MVLKYGNLVQYTTIHNRKTWNANLTIRIEINISKPHLINLGQLYVLMPFQGQAS